MTKKDDVKVSSEDYDEKKALHGYHGRRPLREDTRIKLLTRTIEVSME